MLTQKKFMAIIEENFEERKAILDNPNKKRTAGSPDRMINFKRMAALRMVSEESAAVDLCTKQFTDPDTVGRCQDECRVTTPPP